MLPLKENLVIDKNYRKRPGKRYVPAEDDSVWYMVIKCKNKLSRILSIIKKKVSLKELNSSFQRSLIK